MKTTIHNKHPVFLKLQDAQKLRTRLDEWMFTPIGLRVPEGLQDSFNTLSSYLQALLSYYPEKYAGKATAHDACFWVDDTISNAVEMFGEVELEDYDIKEIMRVLQSAERVQYVIEQEGL